MTPSPQAGAHSQEPSATVVPLRLRGPSDVTAAAVDLLDLNSPHTLAVLSVPAGAAVLDVGCGPGIVARALAERGCRVWGIEIDARKAAVARGSCVEVAEADLEATGLPALFGGQRFDAILCLDVLEHLKSPTAVLSDLRSMLAPGGRVLISVPNVTHGALRLELLQGRFGYRSSGLLDHGHLRFFDARALTDLIQGAALSAETTLRIIKRLDQTEFDIDLETVPPAVLESLKQDPEALTYQFFVVARPVRDGEARIDAASLPERLRARVDQVTAEVEKAGAYARSLEFELQARDEQIRNGATQATRIAELTGELERAATYARHLESEITNRDARLTTLEDQLGSAGTYARHLESELSASQAQVAAVSTAGEAERQRGDETAARALALEELVADVRRLLDDQVSYARYLEGELQKRAGDLAIRDDELHVLRAHIEKTERAIAERDAQLHDARASLSDLQQQLKGRLHELAQRGNDVHFLRDALAAARRTIVERDTDLAAAARTSTDLARALAEDRRRVAALIELVGQHRIRLAAQVADAFVRRAPHLYRLLRPAMVAAVARWRPAEKTP